MPFGSCIRIRNKACLFPTQRKCQKLVDYELDIGLNEGKTLHPELISTQFSQDEMCIICAPDHPLAQQERLVMSDFEHSDWVLREAGSRSREFSYV